MEKYRIDKTDHVVIGQYTFYRIIALSAFADVKVGDKGGYIAQESCLSHYGNCWVYDDAKVSAKATVLDNATLHDTACVRGVFEISGNAVIKGDIRLIGTGLITDNATIEGDAYMLGTTQLTDNASVQGRVYLNGRCSISDNAKAIDGALIFGDCSLRDNVTIGVEIENTELTGNITAINRDDIVFFKYAGHPPYSQMIGFRQNDTGAVMVSHKNDILEIDKFEEVIQQYFEQCDVPDKEKWLKDYRNKINYIRETLTYHSRTFNDD